MRAASLAVIVATCGLLVWVIWSLSIEPFIVRFTMDDSFYYLMIALNLAHGHGSSFDAVNATNGYHPLWLLVLTPIYALTGDDRVVNLRSVLTFQAVACVLPALLLLHRLVTSRGGRTSAALVTGVGIIMLPQRQLNALESGLVIVLGVALAWYASRHDVLTGETAPRERAAVGVLLGLLFLARTDAVFLIASWFAVGAVLQFRAAREGRGVARALGWMLPTLVPVLVLTVPYLAWNIVTFGHLMPVSGALKTSLPHLTFSPRFFGWVTRGLVAAIALGAVVAFVRLGRAGAAASEAPDEQGGRTPRYAALAGTLALGALLHAAYTLFAMNWGVFMWHFAFYSVPFLFILTEESLRFEKMIAGQPGPRRMFEVLAVVVLLIAPIEVLLKFHPDESDSFTVAGYRAALWAREHLPKDARIGMKDAGAFGYFCERRVTNLDGLVNNFEYQAYLDRGALGQYVHDQGLQYIAQPALDANWPQAEHPGYGSITYRLPHTPKGGTFPIYERNEVYRQEWAAESKTHFVIWRLD